MDSIESVKERIAYRNFKGRERLGIVGNNEFERAGLEKQDWFKAVEELQKK